MARWLSCVVQLLRNRKKEGVIAVEAFIMDVAFTVAKVLVDIMLSKYQSRRGNGDLVQK